MPSEKFSSVETDVEWDGMRPRKKGMEERKGTTFEPKVLRVVEIMNAKCGNPITNQGGSAAMRCWYLDRSGVEGEVNVAKHGRRYKNLTK